MKKIIVSLTLVVMLFGGSVAHAQVSEQQDIIALQEQYRVLVMQLIELLTKRIAELQAQLAALQAQQTQAPAPVQIQPVEPQPQVQPPVSGSQASSTVATSTPQEPPKVYAPTIRLEVVGTKVVWEARGERFSCRLNNEVVWQEGSKETNGITNFNLVCVGSETGTKLEKSL